MGKIFIVGVGPGSPEFLTQAAKNVAEKADILIGGKNALSLFKDDKPKRIIDKNWQNLFEFIKKNIHLNIIILTSGDPGFYSILELILKNFKKSDIEVLPGISSMQLCFAKIKEIWHDAKFISLHGKALDNLPKKVSNYKKLVILTDNKSPPNKVASFLINNNVKNKKVVVCDNLALDSEKIIESDLIGISKQNFSGNCIMVIFN